MKGLAGFTDNLFQDRADLFRAVTSIIKPLEQYRSRSKARVKLYPSTGSGFDDVAAQLEGFARPLWAISALSDEHGGLDSHSWVRGLQAGVDPESPEYWGDLGSFDQRMVEMESISFALLTAPEAILAILDAVSTQNLINWLQQINSFTMPQNNWRWFRVLVNLALFKILGSDKKAAKQAMQKDFSVLDQFYLGEGWSSDGVWGDDRKQADYYSGSFAIQFAQLLYVCFAVDDDERVERYRQQAIEFATEYWRYFDKDGAAIPFGRSLTYRFAFGAFWAAFALAGIDLPVLNLSMGMVKGLLLRHLRWWSKQPEIFNSDGTLNIGFTYPNMYLSEDYNSRQSVYWCLKSFVVLGLPLDHSFWSVKEEPHPMEASSLSQELRPNHLEFVKVLQPPHHILCNSPEHHYLLSAGQMTTKKFKAREAKYGKFAYSSAFGFSVPTGPELHQLAPDSTLALSIDGGETWRVRWAPVDVHIGSISFNTGHGGHDLPAITSTWRSFDRIGLQIRTTLIPLTPHYPGWHIRFHRIQGLDTIISSPWCQGIQLVDSAFAVPALTEDGYHISQISGTLDSVFGEGYVVGPSDAHIRSRFGASGIIDLTSHIIWKGKHSCEAQPQGEGHMIAADPNTNLFAQRTFIPSMRYSLGSTEDSKPKSTEEASKSIFLATAIFGVSGKNITQAEVERMWNKRPGLEVDWDSKGDVIVDIF